MGILCTLSANAQWSLTGNSGTVGGPNFIGTTDSRSLVFKVDNNEAMRINISGKISIGTINTTPDIGCVDLGGECIIDPYKLYVKDGIKTEKVKVEIAAENGWADYVFAKDYKLMSLQEVEKYININGHLPEVPTTEEAIKNGIELKEMNILLLKKVEELTLHLIEQNKKINQLESIIKK
ncbi:hypothetical protein [Epilithonimonas sp. UC225_85]|uniref:hypothetical protein n=1 Tax=Epilithonimonas sp. UC225_85 TaxID=3350167 RepID=UPI0036D358A3